MLLREILPVLEAIAPLRYAESWDNVGLIAGDPAASVERVLLAIDYTPAVAAEARRARCELVVAYHPPLFEAVKRVTAPSPIFEAIRDGIALYAPHTALDVAPGGTNDFLADALGMTTRGPLKVAAAKDREHKLVTFVPESDVDRVADALFAAGAGRIGKYASCSFRSAGTGTFLGDEGSAPVVGQVGRFERAPEIRLEMVVPIGKVDAAVKALRQTHPYEEAAFDLVRLAAASEGVGIGRIGTFAEPVERATLIARVKSALGVEKLLVAGPPAGAITRAAVCAGAGRSLLDDAIAQRAELFLTGEIPHHDALRAAAAGMTVLCALHSNSERAALGRVKERIEQGAPGVQVTLSSEDRDPYVLR